MGNDGGNNPIDDAFVASVRTDLLRFAVLQLRDESLASDAVQEALLAAFTSQKEFQGRSALKTWVFAILRHKIVDLLRQQQRSVNVSSLIQEEHLDQSFEALFKANEHWRPDKRPEDWGADPEQALQHRQFWVIFEACLKHLPENTARVFMMREFLELETSEVCQQLELSTSNCHVILHRARHALRQCLEQHWFAPGENLCPSC